MSRYKGTNVPKQPTVPPMPKKRRYIDADRLMLQLNDWWYSQTKIESQNIPYDDNISVTIREAMEAVKEQPTADVRENVRGEWFHDMIYDGEDEWCFFECSNCKYKADKHYNFCPNCGADMRGDI